MASQRSPELIDYLGVDNFWEKAMIDILIAACFLTLPDGRQVNFNFCNQAPTFQPNSVPIQPVQNKNDQPVQPPENNKPTPKDTKYFRLTDKNYLRFKNCGKAIKIGDSRTSCTLSLVRDMFGESKITQKANNGKMVRHLWKEEDRVIEAWFIDDRIMTTDWRSEGFGFGIQNTNR